VSWFIWYFYTPRLISYNSLRTKDGQEVAWDFLYFSIFSEHLPRPRAEREDTSVYGNDRNSMVQSEIAERKNFPAFLTDHTRPVGIETEPFPKERET